MADFSVNATQLSAPQGAGSAPVAPVQGNILGNGVGEVIGKALSIFERGLELNQKDQAQKQEQLILDSYSRKLAGISSALQQGSIKPSEANVRQRAITNEYLASNGHLAPKLSQVLESHTGGTALGQARDEEKAQADSFRRQVDAARNDGIIIPDSAPQSTKQQLVDLHTQRKDLEKQTEDMYKRASYMREEGRYNNDIIKEQLRQGSVQQLNALAGNALDTVDVQLRALREQVDSGKMKPEEAALQWSAYMSRIDGTLQAAASINPELAGGYRSIFTPFREQGAEFFKPGAKVKELENLWNERQLGSKLAVTNDPKVMQAYTTSELFKSIAPVTLANTPIVSQLVANLATGKPTSFVGNKGDGGGGKTVEKQVFGALKSQLNNYASGMPFTPQQKDEMTRTLDLTLQDMGEVIGRANFRSPDLNTALEFIASPSFGKYASENKLSPQAVASANVAFSKVYERDLIETVSGVLSRTFDFQVLNQQRDLTKPRGETTTTTKTYTVDPSNISVNFRNGNVVFDIKKVPDDPTERRLMNNALKELAPLQERIGQLVRGRAHMFGTTNYDKYWEETKGTMFGNFFPDTLKSNTPGYDKSQTPFDDLSTERQATSAMAMSPQEAARDAENERSPANLAELDKEIANTKNPEIKRVLEEYRRSLTKGK